MRKNLFSLTALSIVLFATSCSDDDKVALSNQNQVTKPNEQSKMFGFYLLNEGQMDHNNATLDYFNYKSGIYSSNVYAEINPEVVKELGDVGNDIAIHDGKLFAALTQSNKIEVMDAKTVKRGAQINIPQPRFMAFSGKKGYVTSAFRYEGNVSKSHLDSIYEIDLNTFKVTRSLRSGVNNTVEAGNNPEGIVVANNKLYVANSGGMNLGKYENTVSVINLETFKVEKDITLVNGVNPGKLYTDGKLVFVHIQGNYGDKPASLEIIDTTTDEIRSYPVPMNKMAVADNKLYFFNAPWGAPEVTYGIFDVIDRKVLETSFLTDAAKAEIKTPYGIAVNTDTKEVVITDSPNFGVKGYVCSFDAQGNLKWRTESGVGPASIVFRAN